MAVESRFQMTAQQDHVHYAALVDRARHQIATRVALYHELARSQSGGIDPTSSRS